MAGEIENFGDKAGIGGFHKNPQNINKKGRKPSIDTEIATHLNSDGTITIPKSQVIRKNKDGSIIIKLPTKDAVALRIISLAMSGKGQVSLGALKFLVERMDGKATQKIEASISKESTSMTKEEIEAELKRLDKLDE